MSRSVSRLLLLLSAMAVSVVLAAPEVARMRQVIGDPADGHDDWQRASFRNDWSEFKQQFGRAYNDYEEDNHRMLVFLDNMAFIRRHNRLADMGLKTYRLGVNHFADMTHAEFLEKMTGLRRNAYELRSGSITYISPATKQSLPDSVDWRQKGAVTPVKDQGQCGSCWSFSTTGALEGQQFRKTSKLVSFSEQQLVDCSSAFGNQGCNGGLMDNAFNYIKQFGIETESAYPYTASQGTCRYKKSLVVGSCTGFVDIQEGSEANLQEAVANAGPVSVAIDASHPSFQLYKSGIYNEPDCSSTELDHGVLVVGYGTEAGSDFWLVKNSWNVVWGEQGYIRMSRNSQNQCGIASAASYPTV